MLRATAPCCSAADTAVKLSFKKFTNSMPGSRHPVLICHGLLGSKRNWFEQAKAMKSRYKRDIYVLDQRNHGDSPHSDIHTNEAMADDVLAFMERLHIRQPVLVGHSMGGKVAMTLALRHPDRVSKLAVIDMPPVRLTLPSEVDAQLAGMRAVDQAKAKTRLEVDAIMASFEPDPLVREFLLTNLVHRKDGYTWRVPYETLVNSVANLGDFQPPSSVYPHPTLFITGGASPYRKYFDQHMDLIRAQFPNARFHNMEGVGHWVQAEKPATFLNVLQAFLKD